MLAQDITKMLPPIVQQYLFNLIIPVILAAFFWMCVGVLDNQCKGETDAEKRSLMFTRNAHIGMGVFSTAMAVYTIFNVIKKKRM